MQDGSVKSRCDTMAVTTATAAVATATAAALEPGYRLIARIRLSQRAVPQPVLLGGCLLLVSVIMSLLALVLDLLIAKLYRLRVSLCEVTTGWQRVAVWLASAALLAVLAATVTRSTPRAAGSGVGLVKRALAGKPQDAAFTFRVMAVKSVSLVCAVASGLAVGKEGPFIHLACCVAHMLSNRLRPEVATEDFRLCLLSAAAALGVVCTFGSNPNPNPNPNPTLTPTLTLTSRPTARTSGDGQIASSARCRACPSNPTPNPNPSPSPSPNPNPNPYPSPSPSPSPSPNPNPNPYPNPNPNPHQVPGLSISTCHTYDIHYKFRYRQIQIQI